MAVSYANNQIVTDGLVLALDAGNHRSYPGSGTTWTDLSGEGNNGTLTNGPTFSTSGGGSIVFDGTNDYINFSSFNSDTILGQNFSVIMWIKAVNAFNTRKALITNQDDYNTNGWGLAMNPDGGLNRLFMHINSSTVITANPDPFPNPLDWHMVVGVWDNANTIQSLYFDGTLYATGNSSTTITNSNTSLRIAGHFNNSIRYYQGNISNTFLYNKPLSSTEVSQNFNVLRKRFGI